MSDLEAYRAILFGSNFKLFIHNDFKNIKKHSAIMAEMPDYEKFLKEEEDYRKKINRNVDFYKMYDAATLLSKEQEYHLFKKYNFCKYRFKQIMESNMRDNLKFHHAKKYIEESYKVRNRITQSNLRLLSYIFKSFKKQDMPYYEDLDSIYSDARKNLLCSVDYFDYMRGNKFSTYATWAIRRNMLESRIKSKKYHEKLIYSNDILGYESQDTSIDEEQRVKDIDFLVKKCLGVLSSASLEKERKVIEAYYGLNGKDRKSLSEISIDMGSNRETIRQIKNNGIDLMQKMAEKHNLADSYPE